MLQVVHDNSVATVASRESYTESLKVSNSYDH